jgi:curved DNA-binding protein CbpA
MICWNCREPVGGAVCPGCGKLQPPPSDADHFALLGLPRTGGFEPREVDKAWRKLTRTTHPDRFAGGRAVEKRMAQQWTARAMDARAVLRDPIRRALYLATGSGDLPEQGGPHVGDDFLERMFELQMAARMGEDGVLEQVDTIENQLRARLNEVLAHFDVTGEGLNGIPALIARLRYLRTARKLASTASE